MSNKSDSRPLPSGWAHIRTFQGIEEYRLPNGLVFLLLREPSQANVTVNITYLVGSRHEGRGEAGMAHLLEHMLFRGTLSVRDVKGALQDRGASFNATTWFDRTNYFETLTPTKENLEFALKLEADRMINSTILAEDLASEMTVVRNEFEMGENNPVHVLHDQMMSAAYRWHTYGNTTIGNRSDIERVPAKTLKRFYENYYQPDNAVLIIAGQCEKSDAIELTHKYFAAIPKPTRVLDPTYTEEPAQDGPREVILERAGDMPSVAVGYHIPEASHPDFAAVRVLVDALVDEPAGFLYQKLVESGRSSEVFGMVYALFEPGMAFYFARPKDNDEALKLHEELPHLVESEAIKNLDERQIERIKKRMLKRMKIAISNSKDLALKLSESIACGDWRLFFWDLAQVNKVTLDDVERVLAKYFIRTNRTDGLFIPTDNSLRAHIVPQRECSSLEDLAEDTTIGAGEEFVATASNIEKLVARNVLSPELKMAFLPKKTRGQTVRGAFCFRFGNEQNLTPYVNEFGLIPTMLWRGAGKYDYQGIRDTLDAAMSTLDIGGSAGNLMITTKTDRENLSAVIDLMSEMVKKPHFSPKEFDIVLQREIDDHEEIKNDPQKLAFLELERLKNPWPRSSIHYVETLEEKIATLKKMRLQTVVDGFNDIFATNHIDFSLVGDADQSAAAEQMTNLFASSTQKSVYERIKRPFLANKVVEQTFHTPDKEMALVAMGSNFAMRDDHPDFPALKLANYLFGENMNSRLMTRIREKEGISYGAGSWIEVDRHEQNASLSMYAMAAPHNVSAAKTAIKEEWARLLSEGVMEAELVLAKESICLSFDNLLANDSYLANSLASDFESKRDFHFRQRLFATIKQLNAADIMAAMERFWHQLAFSVVVAGDESKIK